MAVIRRIMVQSQPRQIVLQTLILKIANTQKKGWLSGSSGKEVVFCNLGINWLSIFSLLSPKGI
jgi:hypothetical protein